jgi:hypothetical protein
VKTGVVSGGKGSIFQQGGIGQSGKDITDFSGSPDIAVEAVTEYYDNGIIGN